MSRRASRISLRLQTRLPLTHLLWRRLKLLVTQNAALARQFRDGKTRHRRGFTISRGTVREIVPREIFTDDITVADVLAAEPIVTGQPITGATLTTNVHVLVPIIVPL